MTRPAQTTAVADQAETRPARAKPAPGKQAAGKQAAGRPTAPSPAVTRYLLRTLALLYLLFLLVLPVGLIGWRTVSHGLAPVARALATPEAVHAFEVTGSVAIWSVLANTLFGVGTAVLLVRHRFPGKRVLNALIDLPLAVSPVVVGLALILVYGGMTPVGGFLERHGLQVIFSLPGMVLATIFVSLPLVVRAIEPVLRELGDEQEQAAYTLGAGRLQAFRRITIPGIRAALGYGVVLCLARALGEYGAVAVVSGHLVGQTQTATLFVEERYQNYDYTTAFATATVLALVAVLTLLLTRLLRPKENA